MTFPNELFLTASTFMEAYVVEQQKAINAVDFTSVEAATDILETAYKNNNVVYVCGNGGSAAIANHMVCDHGKLIQTDTSLRIKIHSLSNSSEMMTAIANDISYDEVFSYPLRSLGEKGDVLMTISGSGESPNIIKAIEAAKERQMQVIALTGFTGGKSASLSDVNVHVPCDNYGIAEDVHQSIMQIIAQFIRMKNMNSELIPDRKF